MFPWIVESSISTFASFILFLVRQLQRSFIRMLFQTFLKVVSSCLVIRMSSSYVQVQVASPTSLSVFKAFLVILIIPAIYHFLLVSSFIIIFHWRWCSSLPCPSTSSSPCTASTWSSRFRKRASPRFSTMNSSKEVRFEIVGNSYHVYLTSKGSSTVFFDIVFVRFILPHIRRRGATHAAIQASIAKLQTMKCLDHHCCFET